MPGIEATSRTKLHLRRHLALGVILALLLITVLELIPILTVLHFARPKDVQAADAVVVLGAAAWGRQPSPVFQQRINHAIALYQSHRAQTIIFTGGTPHPDFPSEAEVAKAYAVRRGVPRRAILTDSDSRDTRANLENAAKIAEEHHLQSLIVVSDPYHMARAHFLAKSLHLKVQLSPTPTSRYTSFKAKSTFLIQEAHALWLLWLGWK